MTSSIFSLILDVILLRFFYYILSLYLCTNFCDNQYGSESLNTVNYPTVLASNLIDNFENCFYLYFCILFITVQYVNKSIFQCSNPWINFSYRSRFCRSLNFLRFLICGQNFELEWIRFVNQSLRISCTVLFSFCLLILPNSFLVFLFLILQQFKLPKKVQQKSGLQLTFQLFSFKFVQVFQNMFQFFRDLHIQQIMIIFNYVIKVLQQLTLHNFKIIFSFYSSFFFPFYLQFKQIYSFYCVKCRQLLCIQFFCIDLCIIIMLTYGMKVFFLFNLIFFGQFDVLIQRYASVIFNYTIKQLIIIFFDDNFSISFEIQIFQIQNCVFTFVFDLFLFKDIAILMIQFLNYLAAVFSLKIVAKFKGIERWPSNILLRIDFGKSKIRIIFGGFRLFIIDNAFNYLFLCYFDNTLIFLLGHNNLVIQYNAFIVQAFKLTKIFFLFNWSFKDLLFPFLIILNLSLKRITLLDTVSMLLVLSWLTNREVDWDFQFSNMAPSQKSRKDGAILELLKFCLVKDPYFLCFIGIYNLFNYQIQTFQMLAKKNIPYSTLTNYKQQPKPGATYLIQRNLKPLLDHIIRDVNEFSTTSLMKYRALEQLKYTVLLAEQKIIEHIEDLFRELSKLLYSPHIDHNERLVLEISELIGLNVPIHVTLPVILKILNNQDFKQSNRLAINLLIILAKVLQHQSFQTLQAFSENLFSLLATYSTIFTDNDEGLIALMKIAKQIIEKLHQIREPSQIYILFELLIGIQATKSIKQDSTSVMRLLGQKCGYTTIAQFHAHEVGQILENIVSNKRYTKWTKTSKQRFKFDIIVRNCHETIPKFLDIILEVIQYCIGHQNDLEVRIDTLVLIEFILNIQQLKIRLRPFGVQIIKNILIPSIQWKVGKPQIKIRKAGVINMIKMMNNQIISAQGILSCFKQLLAPLKNCLTDDWAPQLRLASCELVQKFLLLTQQIITDNDLRELYPSLLERLDDAQDPIRKKITLAINTFFCCKKLKQAITIFEYTLNAIFIHFDDHNEEIQDAIYISLKYAARFDSQKVLNQATSSYPKMKNKAKCAQLIEYCRELSEQQMNIEN